MIVAQLTKPVKVAAVFECAEVVDTQQEIRASAADFRVAIKNAGVVSPVAGRQFKAVSDPRRHIRGKAGVDAPQFDIAEKEVVIRNDVAVAIGGLEVAIRERESPAASRARG